MKDAIRALEALLDAGFEPYFDRYGMILYGQYIDGDSISEQILNAFHRYIAGPNQTIEKKP